MHGRQNFAAIWPVQKPLNAAEVVLSACTLHSYGMRTLHIFTAALYPCCKLCFYHYCLSRVGVYFVFRHQNPAANPVSQFSKIFMLLHHNETNVRMPTIYFLLTCLPPSSHTMSHQISRPCFSAHTPCMGDHRSWLNRGPITRS